MLIEGNGLNVIRLLPEEAERLLVAKYGDKLAAIKKVTRRERREQRRTKSADYY
jgi:hypothetical protein